MKREKAILYLADGTLFEGLSIGKKGTSGGEICFNTGMTGYQEIFTDPSYYGQLMVTTNAHIGNYGTNSDEIESESPKIAGLICKNFNFENWTSLINQADYVITPESGCTHIASLTKCKLAVIYDSDNSPHSIKKEYAPWNKEYLFLESSDNELNQKLYNFI